MDDRRDRIPAVIAGWPTEVRSFHMGNTAVELVGVASLESQLDRERLLRDDEFEPPYWALIWSGAVLLASWIERDHGRQNSGSLHPRTTGYGNRKKI